MFHSLYREYESYYMQDLPLWWLPQSVLYCLIQCYPQSVQDCQFGDNNAQATYSVQNEQVEVVIAVVSAYQEKCYWHKHQELFRWRVLVAVIDLLPHGEVIVGAQVELEWRTLYLMEHDV